MLGGEAEAGRLDHDAAAAVLAEAGQQLGRPPPRRPAGLSEREAEVLTLIAQGCSNAEVAERLFISRRTAEHHAQHIYAKIGVSTRAAAALFAVQHGLVAPQWVGLPMRRPARTAVIVLPTIHQTQEHTMTHTSDTPTSTSAEPTSATRAAVAATVAAGFFDDPVTRWLLPDSDRRRRARPADVRAVRRRLPAARRDLPHRRRQRRRGVAAAGRAAARPPSRRRRSARRWRTSPARTSSGFAQLAETFAGTTRRAAVLLPVPGHGAGVRRARASARRSCATCSNAPTGRACPPTTRRRHPGTAPSTSATATSPRASSAAPTARRCGGCGATRADRQLTNSTHHARAAEPTESRTCHVQGHFPDPYRTDLEQQRCQRY